MKPYNTCHKNQHLNIYFEDTRQYNVKRKSYYRHIHKNI